MWGAVGNIYLTKVKSKSSISVPDDDILDRFRKSVDKSSMAAIKFWADRISRDDPPRSAGKTNSAAAVSSYSPCKIPVTHFWKILAVI